ncbi:hypothetical protein ABZX85_22980 [Streptomyces sp. NPDC004539]|uniref:hypothetical protein n=1 Tax=Streptomyces sp. NPDC004539 TaxID=3154280 RepID=UPI0033BF5437
MNIANTPVTGLDLTGFTEVEPGLWRDGSGLLLSAHFFPLVPDLPAPPHDLAPLRSGVARAVAESGGGLIEAEPGRVGGLPAVWQLVKTPLGARPGQAFLASWTVPRDRCSLVLKTQAAEGPLTGVREAAILARVGPDDYFRPHPYGDFGGLPSHVGDLERWDADFPDHPLTRVRTALRRLTPTVTLDEAFTSLPEFPGPPAPRARRGWFRRRR